MPQKHRYRVMLDYIEDWLAEQDEETLKTLYADLLILEEESPALGRPLVDRVKGSSIHNLKEFRPTSNGASVIRILFAFDPGRNAVMLLAGDKSVGKTSRMKWNGWYAKNIPRAELVFRRHLRRMRDHGAS